MDIISWKPSEARRYSTALAYIKLTDAAAVAAAAANAAENAAACINNTSSLMAKMTHIVSVFSGGSVSQVHVALVAVAIAFHCERSCARENVSVTDMPVSGEI